MRKLQFRKYTEEQFIQAVKDSTSIRQVLTKLNVKEAGGNYYVANKYIKLLKLDTKHFTGPAWNKGKTIGPKRPIEDYLSNKYQIQSDKLKKRLINENIFIHKCCDCNNTSWKDKPIPLELHHLDGNHLNNILSNLKLLCPNCHAQTNNYRGKNKK